MEGATAEVVVATEEGATVEVVDTAVVSTTISLLCECLDGLLLSVGGGGYQGGETVYKHVSSY